jgi:hypothetical protein
MHVKPPHCWNFQIIYGPIGARNRVGRRPASVGILEQFMGPQSRVEIGFSYRAGWVLRLAESIPWYRFLGSLKV